MIHRTLYSYGILGIIASESGSKKTSDVIEHVIKKSNIDIPQIVREEFKKELKNTNLFGTIQPTEGNCPEFKLFY